MIYFRNLLKFFFAFSFLVFSFFQLNGQTTITYAPTDNSSNIIYTNPICRDQLGVGAVPAKYTVSEYIFTKDELNSVGFNTSGDITSIAFYKNSQTSTVGTCPNVKVYMKLDAASTLSTGFWSYTGYTLVFSGTYDHGTNTQTGWRTITLQTPFNFDNSKNLHILITNESGVAIGSGGSEGPKWRFTLYSGGDTRCRFNTSETALPNFISATGNRANIRITYVPPCIPPSITVHPNTSAASTCQNGTAFSALSVTATGSTPFSYQWYSNTVASNSGGTAITGATSATYTPSNATVGTLYYYCIVTNSCGSATSNVSGARTVNPRPGLNTVTGGGSYCSGTGGVPVGLSSSEAGVNYTLYLGGVSTGNTQAGTGGAIGFGNQTSGGNYTVIATNGFGCTSTMTGSVTVTVLTPPAITTHPNTASASTCINGTAFTQLSVAASGSATLSYQWYSNTTASNSGGTLIPGATSTTYTPPNNSSGTLYYYCVVTNGCGTATTNVSGPRIVNPLPDVYSVTGGGSSCSGGSGVLVGVNNSQSGVNYSLYLNGTATGSTIGGTGTAISFGNQTSAGTYTVVATGSGSCTSSMSGNAVITVNPTPAAQTITGGGAYCSSGSGVSIDLSGSQSGVNYTLYLNSVSTGNTIGGTGGAISFGNQTAAGTYTVVATGAGSCTASMPGSTTITVNPTPVAQTVTGGGSYCSDGSGQAVGLSGSQSGVNYTLYLNSVSTGNTIGGTGGAISFGNQTAAGTYTVVATGSGSCTASMTGNALITVNPVPAAQNVTGGGTYCSGGSGVLVGVSGSEPGVNYTLYLNGVSTGNTLAGTGSALSFGNQTAAGNYTVTAVNGTTSCSAGMSGTITVSITALPNIYEVSGGGTFCAGAAGAQVGMNNSQAGVTYTLYLDGVSTGQTLSGTGGPISFGNQTAAGTYTIIASLGGSCTQTMAGSATIIVKPLPQLFNVSGGGSYCAGGNGQSIALDGSEPGTTYELYLDGTPIGNTLTGTGNALTWNGLTASGSYSIHATGTTLCESDMTGTATIGIYPLPVISSVATTVNTSCTGNNGELCINAAGGTAPYTYSLDGVNYITDNTFTALAAGTVTIYVLDQNGCSATSTATITDQSGFAIDSIQTVNLSCNGDLSGEIIIYAVSGSQYSIDNGITLVTGNHFTGLQAGTYPIYATDNLGCTATTTVTLTQPVALSVTFTATGVSCNGMNDGLATANPAGGTAPYSYLWSDPSASTTSTAGGLAPDLWYFVTITDANNCTHTDSIMIDEPAVLQAIFDTQVNISCNGGSDGALTTVVSGGTPSYSYQWSPGISSVSGVATGLSAGVTYTVTISDAHGCSVSISQELTEPDAMAIVFSSQNPTCGNNNGNASADVTGGVGPYSYLWSNSENTQNISNLSAGIYSVTISDSHGCTQTNQITLSDNGAVSITSVNLTGTNCYGDSTGTAVLNISGGNPSYTILLSGGDSITTVSSSATFSGLPSAVYNYTLTDAAGCTANGTFTISGPSAPVFVTAAVQHVTCFNAGNGSIAANAGGGTQPYTYNWSGGQTTATLINLTAGTYFVTVTDANGCSFASDSITITQPERLLVELTGNSPSCGGYGNGSAFADAEGGTPPYTYSWSNMASTASVTGLSGGTYTVTITDANGCTFSAPLTISEPAPVIITGETGTNPDYTGYINTTISGGSVPYTFQWSNGAATDDLSGLGASGTYTITVTDANQCVYTYDFNLLLDIIIPNVITPNADGKNDDFFITNIEGYEKISVEIFNRWGTRLFVFSGSGAEYSSPGNRFDGTYEGKNLPMGSYVYIVILNDTDVYTGALLIKF